MKQYKTSPGSMIIPDSKIWTSDPKKSVVRGFTDRTDYPQKREFSEENGFPDSPGKVRCFGQLVGQSDAMLELYDLIEAVAVSTANVIIGGESGTGKELVAQALHTRSLRRKEAFVAVNCSAFPREILENELFGHEHGAFTGALKEKPGCFELADKGTLFLDEICEMPLDIQAKMLRVLEQRSFRRLGGRKEVEVDVRIIAASNKNLERAVREKSLREDLYYRLCVIEIQLPPLRERAGDLVLLIDNFLTIFREKNKKDVWSLSTECLKALGCYHWPGNVRELKNTIERAVILSTRSTLQLDDLPQRIIEPENGTLDIRIPIGTTLVASERQLIYKTLEFASNNKTKAAQILGISLKTLHNKLNQYRSMQP